MARFLRRAPGTVAIYSHNELIHSNFPSVDFSMRYIFASVEPI